MGCGPQDIARAILDGFDKHYRLFRAISAGAKERFECGDWAAVRQASRDRIDMYDARVREAVAGSSAPHATGGYTGHQTGYVSLLLEHRQPELAETFFNSVAARAGPHLLHECPHLLAARRLH